MGLLLEIFTITLLLAVFHIYLMLTKGYIYLSSYFANKKSIQEIQQDNF